MVKWDTPNGEMGYPKWENGIPQKAKWDTPKGKMGHPKWRNGTSQMAGWGIGAWITRWNNKGRVKMGGQTLVLYFCVFVNAKRQGGLIHLIKSTNESFIDYYIYYRHAHLFSQKHKNTKTQKCKI
ncbi:MAG: hypothetical protein IKC18_07085 [Bacteroidaceae bacterium]|nr:hypothetical protein [Bacteroidaceae bacterium]